MVCSVLVQGHRTAVDLEKQKVGDIYVNSAFIHNVVQNAHASPLFKFTPPTSKSSERNCSDKKCIMILKFQQTLCECLNFDVEVHESELSTVISSDPLFLFQRCWSCVQVPASCLAAFKTETFY